MAKESRMHLLMVEYDEGQKDLLATFGVTNKEMTALLNSFIDAANAGEDETYTSKLMGLIKAGEVSGGMILTLATQAIISVLDARRISSAIDGFISDLQQPPDEDEDPKDK
jgi:hypothetical protein